MKWWMIVATGLALGACTEAEDDNPDTGTTDMWVTPDSGQSDMGSGAEDTGAGGLDVANGDVGADGGEDMGDPPSLMEMEPNDGNELDEVNDLPVGERLGGVLTLGDSDIFLVPTQPGAVYEVSLQTTNIAHHITVIDYGRGGDSPGEDYVKISRGETLQFVSMGEGGHLVVVRDSNNVDGGMVGGDDFTYVVEVRELDPATVTEGALTLGDELSGTLAAPSDVQIWTFDGTAGMDVVFDMSMPNGDGRLYVVATATGDWIARQDNRAIDDPNPLLDAPLTASGAMWLVVEDITESGPPRAYTIQTGP